jgi:hypothetical protein
MLRDHRAKAKARAMDDGGGVERPPQNIGSIATI